MSRLSLSALFQSSLSPPINTEAGYSVAALHYHFRTRQKLLEALLLDRQQPVMARRAELLHSLQKNDCPDVLTLAEALVLPFAQLILSEPEQGLISVKFFFRAYVAKEQLSWARKSTQESLKIFDPLLAQVLPGIDQKTRRTRWLLATELTFQGLANMDTIMRATAQTEARKNRERYVRLIIEFVAGGLRYSA